jgi:uncharacterized protein DUF1573
MSTRKPAPGGAKPAPGAQRPRHAVPIAQAKTKRKGGRDFFGLYFILGGAVFIFLFGAAVWGLRSLNSQAAQGLPTATVETASQLPLPAVDETPLPNFTPPPSPTLPAPDALNSGPFVESTPVTSVVTDAAKLPEPMKLPPQIPQPKIDMSVESVDLGAVKLGDVITREVTIANPGTHDLYIDNIASDCACVGASIAAQKIPSGSRTHMTVVYDSTLEPNPAGRYDHTLTIFSTDGQEPEKEFLLSVALQ